MADLLVKLYALPPLQPALDAIAALNIQIRPARNMLSSLGSSATLA